MIATACTLWCHGILKAVEKQTVPHLGCSSAKYVGEVNSISAESALNHELLTTDHGMTMQFMQRVSRVHV